MNQFINENFLLDTQTAQKLYYNWAEKLPVIDFHNHLYPQYIADDYRFDNLGQMWLEGDHYKWRVMRINGVNEHYCTGKASDKEKFIKWSETVPFTVGNPLYHWTHLELTRYFGINVLLSPATAEQIYRETQEKLQSSAYSVRNLLKKMNVEMMGTTDDPADDLRYHQQLKRSGFEVKVQPSFRADNVLNTGKIPDFIKYIEKLGQSADIHIIDIYTLLEALDKRHAFFHEIGGRLSDSGIERFYYAEFTIREVDVIFKKLLAGKAISDDDSEKYHTCVMAELARLNHKRGWVQQFHVGAIRNNSSRQYKKNGSDSGFDSIGATQDPLKMSSFLNLLDKEDQLAKTILYNLNPADNEMFLTMSGNFNDGSVVGKVQYGAAWWFLDQKNGMEKHLKGLSSLALLSRFVGMVTDSRSFLSFTRHEYFRRIVCNYIGHEVEKGLIPNDDSILKLLVEGIAYRNAKNYFEY